MGRRAVLDELRWIQDQVEERLRVNEPLLLATLMSISRKQTLSNGPAD